MTPTQEEVGELRSQLIAGFVVEPFYSRVLDRSVHAYDLTIGSRMVGLGQPVLEPVGFADRVEAHWSAAGHARASKRHESNA